MTGSEAGNGTLLAGVAKAGFLIGLEKNGDRRDLKQRCPGDENYDSRTLYFSPDFVSFSDDQKTQSCEQEGIRRVRNIPFMDEVETIALGFQHYIVALGTVVMIPSFLVPSMGGNDTIL